MKNGGSGFGSRAAHFDEQFIKETVRNFLDQNKISFSELARILGVEAKSSTWISEMGKRFFEDDHRVTLDEVSRIAHWMRCSFTDLLRVIQPAVSSSGSFATNVYQTGAAAQSTNSHSGSLKEALEVLASLSPDQRRALLGDDQAA